MANTFQNIVLFLRSLIKCKNCSVNLNFKVANEVMEGQVTPGPVLTTFALFTRHAFSNSMAVPSFLLF